LQVTALARPAASALRIAFSGAGTSGEAEVGLDPAVLRVPLAAGTREVDLRLEASALYRVAGLALVRARGAAWALVGVFAALVGLLVLALTGRRQPAWAALTWGLLAALAVVVSHTFTHDPASFLRMAEPARLAARLAVLAALWVVSMAGARSRLAAAVAITGT